MSQTVVEQSRIRDLSVLQQTCQRMQLPAPALGTHKLFSTTARGWAVKLPGWSYPCVFEGDQTTLTGKMSSDNYNGRWGNPAELDRLTQGYCYDYLMRELQIMGGSNIQTMVCEDGSIKVDCDLLQVG